MFDETSASDYSGITLAEFEPLHLPTRSMEQLAELLDAQANGTISPSDLAKLEGVREAAFYLRMDNHFAH